MIEIEAEAVFILLFASLFVVVGVVLYFTRTDEASSPEPEPLVERLGFDEVTFQASNGTDIRGVYRGVAVHLMGEGYSTRLTCTLSDDLPRGMSVDQDHHDPLRSALGFKDIQIGHGLDAQLRIKGEDADAVRALITHPPVLEILKRVIGPDAMVWFVSPRTMTLVLEGELVYRASTALQVGTDLYLALDGYMLGAWRGLADRYSLVWNSTMTSMVGEVAGVAIGIRLQEGAEGRRTEIVATLERALPAGTRVVHAACGEGQMRLPDPIMDGLLSVETTDVEVLAERVCDDAVRGLLLEVLHGHPGSVLTEDMVMLSAPGRLRGDLERTVDVVVELARALCR